MVQKHCSLSDALLNNIKSTMTFIPLQSTPNIVYLSTALSIARFPSACIHCYFKFSIAARFSILSTLSTWISACAAT
jgi:hypothetical protein